MRGAHCVMRWIPVLLLMAFAAEAQEATLDVQDETEPPAEAEAARIDFGPTTGLVYESEAARLELHVFSWLRAQTDTRVGDETDVEATIPIARLALQGSVLDERLFFFFQPELSGTRDDELLDLFVEWVVDERLRLRAGQFRTPFSRAFITPLTNLQLTERGFVVDEFAVGRDTGVMASGSLASGRFAYDLGIFNGAGINDLSGDRDAPLVVARTELRFGDVVPYDQVPSLVLDDPHGLVLALGGSFSRRGITQTAGATRSTTTEQLWNATADVAWMHGPLSVHAEGFWRAAEGSPRPAHAFGAFIQAGLFVVPGRLEAGGRAGWISNGPDVQSYEAFLASYWQYGETQLGQHLKTLLDYRYDSGDSSGLDLRDRHRVTLQTQIFF